LVNSNIFINCPFDKDYERLFRPLIFTIQVCGFNARSAKERFDTSEIRLEKIFELIDISKFSIHDISRVEIDKNTNFPRFNIPFELGIFVGAKQFGPKNLQRNYLVLDKNSHRFKNFISDIAGCDIAGHSNRIKTLIQEVRNWLFHNIETNIPGADRINQHYQQFSKKLPLILKELGVTNSNLIFREYLHIVTAWLEIYPLHRPLKA
jgi:hypothetical protein